MPDKATSDLTLSPLVDISQLSGSSSKVKAKSEGWLIILFLVWLNKRLS